MRHWGEPHGRLPAPLPQAVRAVLLAVPAAAACSSYGWRRRGHEAGTHATGVLGGTAWRHPATAQLGVVAAGAGLPELPSGAAACPTGARPALLGRAAVAAAVTAGRGRAAGAVRRAAVRAPR